MPNNLQDLTKILAKRLTKYFEDNNYLSPTQAGFRKGFSTHSHIFTMHQLLDNAHYFDKELIVAALDLFKAFDSVPHHAIRETLQHYHLPPQAVNMIMELYKESKAQVLTPYGPTTPFTITRGVKQGDPLSPILFIIFFNPLLTTLNQQEGYRFSATQSITNLSFADDLHLLSESESQMQNLLNIVEQFCEVNGMQLNTSKSKVLARLTTPTLTYKGTLIPQKVNKTFRMLGVKISLDKHVLPLQNKLNKYESRISTLCRRQLALSTLCKLIHPYGLQAVTYMTYTTPILKAFADKIDKITRKHLYIRLGFKETTKQAIHNPLPFGLGVSSLWHLHQQNFITFYLNVLNGKPTLAQQVALENHFLAAGHWSLHPLLPSLTPTVKKCFKMFTQLNKLTQPLNIKLIEMDHKTTQLEHHF